MAIDNPVRILTAIHYAQALAAAMTIPHTISAIGWNVDAEIIPALRQADVLVNVTYKAAWATAAEAETGPLPLRLVHSPGAGIDGIDFAALPPGCIVCNVYGHEYALAEYTFMVMAALNRRLFQADRALRAENWGDRQPSKELRGRTLLIIGAGHIGAELARWGNFMGMKVIGVTRTPSPLRAVDLGLAELKGLGDLRTLLPTADFVVVAVPHAPETEGLIGAVELGLMQPTAFLVNVGRGPVVQETALYQALREGWIGGAAIDVWYKYPVGSEPTPPASPPFHELDNIIMTPHTAGYTDGTMNYRWQFMAENIRRLVQGEPLEQVVWPRAGGG